MCFGRANFDLSIRPDGSAPAALASLLLEPPEPQNIEKHSLSRLFYLFARLHLLSTESTDSFSAGSFFSLTARTTVAASVFKSEL
jgi:hypothetical protein